MAHPIGDQDRDHHEYQHGVVGLERIFDVRKANAVPAVGQSLPNRGDDPDALSRTQHGNRKVGSFEA